jgi:hypothetical protein
MNMAIYLLNRSLNKVVIEVTPEEAWTSVKPKVNHLKIFGSVAYDVTTCRKLLFVGYVDKRKEYRFVDPCKNEVVVSRDVRINENSDLNQNDDHWFEVDKSTTCKEVKCRKVEQSSCYVMKVELI